MMATILGADGKPILQEVASIERDISRVFYGRTLPNEDPTLVSRGAGKGLKIYEELKRDAHAGAVLAKRKLAVTSRPWNVEPASESAQDKLAAELVQTALEALRFNHIRKRLLEATLMGYAVGEVMWELRDGLVMPANVLARKQQRFVFDLDGGLHLRTPQNMIEGELMPPRKFIVHRRGADDDNPYGMGIGGMLFWPVFFKRNTITFWLTFADKFGSPTALGKYPNGAQDPEKNKLLAALQSIAQDAGVIVPEGMTIELLEAARSGTIDTYEKLVRYMDEQMSKAVLGETMSTTAASTGLGSNQAGVQNDVRLEVAQDDANELDETLNDTLVRWIVEFNMPGAGVPKLCSDFAEPEDLAARATRDKTLFDMGWEPSEKYMLDTYGEGWTKKAPPPSLPPLMPGQAMGGNTAEDPEEPAAPGAVVDFKEASNPRAAAHAQRQAELVTAAEALAGQWRQVMGKRVEDLVAVLEQTGDLVQFRERLPDLLNAEPDPAAVELIARSTFAGNVMGRGKPAEAPKKPGLFSRLVKAAAGRGG